MVTIAEYNRQSQQATGTLYEIGNCGQLTDFNRNFNYKEFYGKIGDKAYYTMKTLTQAVKDING